MEDKKDEQQPNLPTIREIESQIWEIAKSDLVGPMQLKACRFLIKRIEARRKRRIEPRKLRDGGICKNGRSSSR